LTQHSYRHGRINFVRLPKAWLGLASILLVSTALVACAPAQQNGESTPTTQSSTSQTSKSQIASDNDEFTLVSTQEEYAEAVKSLNPGDTIVLANGRWKDFEILFTGKGTEDAPIRLRGETPGEVILTGQSNLRLGGEYLEVSGLVFKDGHTPTQEVIAFRQDKDRLANNSRVTEVVVDNFNQPQRFETDFWVMMYGKNNRFDHNHLVGKRNQGVTMAVRMTTDESRENYHRIDHNYFGPRPILGSNGGETLRIGTSIAATASWRLFRVSLAKIKSSIIHFLSRAGL